MNLVLHQISKSWGGLQVLTDVSMTVDAGGITGLIGPNGAGKSTLFGAISGNVPVDRGSIRFGDELLDSLDASRRARCGLLRTFQVPRPFANLSVRANLAVAARDQIGESLLSVFFRPSRVRRREAEIFARAERVIDTLNLKKVADHAASQLSGGQLKLLELGRLLMTEPRMILLDEPFAGVNPVLAEELAERIRVLHAGGLGFFIVEHDLGALSRLASTLFAMDRGVLIANGTPDEVLSNPQVRTSYVGG
jgi:branched-chain amino acid transport system ATP-binding protein